MSPFLLWMDTLQAFLRPRTWLVCAYAYELSLIEAYVLALTSSFNRSHCSGDPTDQPMDLGRDEERPDREPERLWPLRHVTEEI